MSDTCQSKLTPAEKRTNLVNSLNYILFYTLSYTIAIAISELFNSIFHGFSPKTYVLTKTIYIIVLISITMFLAYRLDTQVGV